MIEKISLVIAVAVAGEASGDFVPLEKTSARQIESKIEETIAELFSQICFRNNSIEDQEIRTAEKFHFALYLKNHLKEIKENADRITNN